MNVFIVFAVSSTILISICFLTVGAAPITEEEPPLRPFCDENEPCAIAELDSETLWPPRNFTPTSCRCKARIYCITLQEDRVGDKFIGLCRKLPADMAPLKDSGLDNDDEKINEEYFLNLENFNI